MMKIFTLVALFLTALFASQQVAVQADDAKHCHPRRCCGCDRDLAKPQVRRLMSVYNAALQNQQNGECILKDLFIECPEIKTIGEFCDSGSCCTQNSTVCQWFNNNVNGFIRSFIYDVALTRQDEVIVTGLMTNSFHCPKHVSYVFNYTMVWVPTEGCNYRIASINSHSLACPEHCYKPCCECT